MPPRGSLNTLATRSVRGAVVTFDASTLEVVSIACNYEVHRLAAWAEISPRHLRRQFAQLFGCSPQKWLREARLQAARRVLPEARSIKEVAYGLNFPTLSQFCRDFRARFGCTPSAYVRAVSRPGQTETD